jgi:FlaA1/EpsC-like NDP-sugar epimerase
MAAPMVLFLLAGQIYDRIWSRARLREYVLLLVLIMAGSLTGTGLQILLEDEDRVSALIQLAMFTPMAGLMIVGVRVLWRMVQEFMSELEASRLLRSSNPERVLAYGAGGRFQLFLREHLFHVGEADAHRLIVGVLDDDPNLRNCRVSGIPVLGSGDSLSAVIRAHHITCVIITALLPEEKKRHIGEQVRASGAAIKEWSCGEADLP